MPTLWKEKAFHCPAHEELRYAHFEEAVYAEGASTTRYTQASRCCVNSLLMWGNVFFYEFDRCAAIISHPKQSVRITL